MKKSSIFLAILFVLLGFSYVVMGILVAKEFDDIGESSVLRYLVDREIRKIPTRIPSRQIIYTSHPQNGNKRALNSIKLQTEDICRAEEEIHKYLIGLGYENKGLRWFVRGSDEVEIRRVEGEGLVITKYSWD